MQLYPEVMAAEEAVHYLRSRIGDVAPVAETLREWSTPSYRKGHAAVVEKLRIPLGIVVEGTKKRAWSRAALDAYADGIIAAVRRHDPEPGTAGERTDARA